MTAYTARRTPVHRGTSGWRAILPPGAPPQPLPGDLAADVALVGGGFAGLAAARRLREIDPALRIAVLEASGLAEGASGRNSGFMIDLPHDLVSEDYAGEGDDRSVIALNRKAIGFARRAVEDYAIPPDWFDPIGKINGAASPGTERLNDSYARHLAAMGEASERLDPAQMREVTGSPHYFSGLYTPGAVMLQPAGFIQALGQGLRRDGVGVWEGSPVTRIARDGMGWIVTTPHGRVRAARVILTNNGHLESFGFAPGRLMHIFLYASMTRELDAGALRALGGQPRWGITPSDPMGTTMRRIDPGQGGNRIVTRTCATYQPGMEASEATLRRAAAVHRRKFDERFPQLAGARMEYSWAGHLCLTRNGVSVVRQLDDGLWAATVCNGLGTTRSTLTGIAGAELAMGQSSDATRHFDAEAEASRLPPRPFASLGANAYLRWKEHRATAE